MWNDLSFARTFSLASSLEYGWVMMWCVGVVHNRSESVQAVCDELYTQLQNKEKQMQEFQVKFQTSSKFIEVTPYISFILHDMHFTREFRRLVTTSACVISQRQRVLHKRKMMTQAAVEPFAST